MDKNTKKSMKIIDGGKPDIEAYEYENVPHPIIDYLLDGIAKSVPPGTKIKTYKIPHYEIERIGEMLEKNPEIDAVQEFKK